MTRPDGAGLNALEENSDVEDRDTREFAPNPTAERLTARFPILAQLETAIESNDRLWYGLLAAIVVVVALAALGASPALILLLIFTGSVIAFVPNWKDSNSSDANQHAIGAQTPIGGTRMTGPASSANVDADVRPGVYVTVVAAPGSAWQSTAGIVTSVDSLGFQLIPRIGTWNGGEQRVLWERVGNLTVSEAPTTFVRTYKGKQQANANVAFQHEANVLSKAGYEPSTQSWAAGQYGCGAFLIALLLCVVLVGILIFIYMLIVKPDGTLTVTFTRRAGVGAGVVAAPPPPPIAEEPTRRLEALDRARTAGLISDEEYASTRARILNDF